LNKLNSFFKKNDPLFWVCVVIPTIVLTFYYGFIASDVYISQSKFVIRSPNQQSVSGLGVMLKNIGFNASSDDSYIVRDYLTSRDSVKILDQNLAIKSKYSKADIDAASRFGTFFQEDTFESFYDYFNKKVKVNYDPASSISELQVRAYTPQDAQQINAQLLKTSEAVVNRINSQAKNDILKYSLQEVKNAQAASAKAAENLANYRTDKAVFNPEGQSMIVLQEISKLQDALIQAQTQLAQAQSLAPDNPQIEPMKLRIQTLQTAIKAKSEQVTGPSDRSLSNRSADYQRLQLEKELADKQLASAMVSYETAKNDFSQKQLYLATLAQPSLPDAALEPNRLKNILSGFIFGLLTWGVLRLFVAGVKEHND
jgi:capsular polysaccharide transport system permease protein